MRFNTVGERVRYARKEAGLSVQELAKRAGMGGSSIYDLERGDSKGSTKLARIAEATGFSALWLETERGPEHSVAETRAVYGDNVRPPAAPVVSLPIVSWASAGTWAEAVDCYEPGDAEGWYPAPPHIRCSGSSYWTEVQGRSMISTTGGQSYPPGSLILVDPEVRDAITGRLILARQGDTHEVTFKRLNIEDGAYFLEPLNTQYSVIRIDSESQIIGTILSAVISV